jgi:hypothetical protein
MVLRVPFLAASLIRRPVLGGTLALRSSESLETSGSVRDHTGGSTVRFTGRGAPWVIPTHLGGSSERQRRLEGKHFIPAARLVAGRAISFLSPADRDRHPPLWVPVPSR